MLERLVKGSEGREDMSDNKKIISDWLDATHHKLVTREDNVHYDQQSENYFYVYFGDSPTNYDPASYSMTCEVSSTGLPVGGGVITMNNTWVWPHCSSFTSWPHTHTNNKLHSVEGSWDSGVCQGLQVFTYCNGVTFRAVFSGGVPHGLAVGYFNKKVIWVGRYVDGECAREFCSIEPEGGSLLTGECCNGDMTGPDMTFLYPDMKTGLQGSWQDGVMVAAREVMVNRVCVEEDYLRISCSACFGPEFSYAPSGANNFGCSDPLLRDPYESKYIEVKESEMEGGGEGVYAKVDIPKNTIAAVFNGYKVPLSSGTYLAEGIEDEEKIYERLSYNIHMPEDEDFFLDLPPAMASLSVYSASLGHKVNHSFIPNSVFGTMYHPRWGRVRTVETMGEVEEGQELLVDYGYDLLRCPQWYRDLWTRQLGGSGKKYWEYKREAKV